MKKNLFSGVKPTGRPHIGNYFGAMEQFIELSRDEQYDCYFMIADYHALNLIQNREELKKNIIDLAIDYLSIGLDPTKSVIFKQSDVSAHTELAWIFDSITTMPYLMRAHAFKDAEAKNKEINVGTFNYPMLMASDILLYDSHVVPVGQDQKQHIEYTRDTAIKFNNIFGDTFIIPEPLILENVATIPGTDGRKMSKSYKNTIPLFSTREEIIKAVMSIITDSSGDLPINVYNIHKLFKSENELKTLYSIKNNYKAIKEALIEDIDTFMKPLREKRASIQDNIPFVEKILEEGGQKANHIAQKKLSIVKKNIGVSW
jgi:tryptophanyl-tRNA synthetase